MRLFLIFLMLVMAGCGYHFRGQSGSLPGGVERVHVLLFENRTSEPLLENRLTNEVKDQLFRFRKASLVEAPESADAILSGIIRSFESRSLAYSQDDLIGKFRATMVVDVSLTRNNSDETLWSGRSSWSTEYDAAVDTGQQSDQKSVALEELMRRLSEEIFYQMLDDF